MALFFALAMGLRIDMFGIFVRSIETILAYYLLTILVTIVLRSCVMHRLNSEKKCDLVKSDVIFFTHLYEKTRDLAQVFFISFHTAL